jgi:hypothetical protein
MRTAVFVEAWEGEEFSNLQVCRMVTGALYRRHLEPLPFATTEAELHQVIAAVRRKALSPVLYVVNTFSAEELLKIVDGLIGDTPLLLMHRELFSYNLIHKKSLQDTTQLLKSLRPRLTVLCGYGSQTAHLVAERVAQALLEFLRDGDFGQIETLSSRLAISSGQEP